MHNNHFVVILFRYPRVVREWKRGTPLDSANAVKVFEGEATDVLVAGFMVPSINNSISSMYVMHERLFSPMIGFGNSGVTGTLSMKGGAD